MVEITQLENDTEELPTGDSVDEEKQKESKGKKRKRNKIPVKVFYVIKAEATDATEISQIRKTTIVGILAVLVIILLISTVVLAVMYNVASSSKEEPQMPAQSEVSSLPTPIASGPLKIISRQEWHSRSPEPISNLLSIPVSMVMISQTATGNCTNRTSCEKMVQLLQQIDMDNRGLGDVCYNFMVGGDGLVYEGRGWAVEGYHMAGYNNKSISIAFIGTKHPTVQITACKKLIEYGKEKGYIASKYLLIGANQVMPTLYALLGEVKS